MSPWDRYEDAVSRAEGHAMGGDYEQSQAWAAIAQAHATAAAVRPTE